MSAPNTIINFYDVYDLTPDYNHTRYFANSDARDDYFDDNIAETVTPTQHIRIDQLEVKIPLPIEDIHGYTYMSIQNSKVIASSDTYDHRYYCFITDMEYVSDMCTLVSYQIDVMQTYCMDGLFSSNMAYQCFVTRCHSLTDEVGDNILDEPFKVDDYIIMHDAGATVDLHTYYIVVGICTARYTTPVTIDGEEFDFRPTEYNEGIFTGVRYYAFTLPTDATKLNLLLKEFDGHENEIVSIYSCPQAFINKSSQLHHDSEISGVMSYVNSDFTDGVNGSQNNEGFEGYDPKNNKLFTFPFTKLRLTNLEGEHLDLAFELFTNPNNCGFVARAAFIGEPNVTISPCDYGKSFTHAPGWENHDYSLSMSNFCCGALANDAYASYLNKESLGSLIKCIAGTVASAGIGFMFGGGAGLVGALATGASVTAKMAKSAHTAVQTAKVVGAGTALRGLADMTADNIRAKNTSSTPTAQNSKGNVAQQNGFKSIHFQRMKIRRYLAEQIDDFFTMYGYAQNRLMNIGDYLENNTRPYFAYVQTSNFSVMYGGFEQKYKMEIANIMNKGITFWFSTSDAIGRYDLNNAPVQG